jgi:hypothetical protein
MFYPRDIVEGYSEYYQQQIILYVGKVHDNHSSKVRLQGYRLNSSHKLDKRTQWQTSIICDLDDCRVIRRNVDQELLL